MWQAGDTVSLGTMQLSREQIVRYAGASGDFNPIHYDEDRARGFGLPGVIAHGMLSMGVLARLMGQAAPPGSRIERYGVRFRTMVRPQEPLTATARVISVDGDGRVVLDLVLRHDDGRVAVSGEAVLTPLSQKPVTKGER
ncbi:dehydratase [Sulfobacillus acidophilus TPY]|uniref:MaoC domain protein dehydratase n=1 Tax=Sulfobacillus acidophilus (strain ATCC 700253 / DSM 10332 / NAL) TaxID=679936 RepID=G8TSB1_SULAD|nr:dehydratase [Sulfobacillus acidophilus TPY]AEW05523.1 MaoC domain protein dehydratase [Sulfobacillus acidophilus DSM 10332]